MPSFIIFHPLYAITVKFPNRAVGSRETLAPAPVPAPAEAPCAQPAGRPCPGSRARAGRRLPLPPGGGASLMELAAELREPVPAPALARRWRPIPSPSPSSLLLLLLLSLSHGGHARRWRPVRTAEAMARRCPAGCSAPPAGFARGGHGGGVEAAAGLPPRPATLRSRRPRRAGPGARGGRGPCSLRSRRPWRAGPGARSSATAGRSSAAATAVRSSSAMAARSGSSNGGPERLGSGARAAGLGRQRSAAAHGTVGEGYCCLFATHFNGSVRKLNGNGMYGMKNYKRGHTRDELISNGTKGITSIFQWHTGN